MLWWIVKAEACSLGEDANQLEIFACTEESHGCTFSWGHVNTDGWELTLNVAAQNCVEAMRLVVENIDSIIRDTRLPAWPLVALLVVDSEYVAAGGYEKECQVPTQR